MNKLLELVGWATSTKERRKLLNVMTTEKGRLSDLAKKAGVSKSLASQFIRKLGKEKIVVSKEKELVWSDTPQARELKRLTNLSRLDLSALSALPVRSVLLYGSWAEGTNTAESDVDLCVLTEKPVSEMEIASVSGRLSRQSGFDVHILLLDEKKAKQLKEKSPTFYAALAYQSIRLQGEPI